MSDKNAFGFGAFVPGFDFLQGLVQSAAQGAAGGTPQGAPDWSKWVAPTLQVEEIEKRVNELKTVQFWLEQNARALAATIQALEVQKMTLATLKGMNVQVNDLASAFGFKAGPAQSPAASPSAARAAGAGPYDDMFTQRPAGQAAAEPEAAPAAAAPAAGTVPKVDPVQWWNALAGQFQQIAAGAMQDAAEKARSSPNVDLQGAARQAFEAAGRMAAGVAAAAVAPVKPAAAPRKKAAKKAAAAPRKTASKKTSPPPAAGRRAR